VTFGSPLAEENQRNTVRNSSRIATPIAPLVGDDLASLTGAKRGQVRAYSDATTGYSALLPQGHVGRAEPRLASFAKQSRHIHF